VNNPKAWLNIITGAVAVNQHASTVHVNTALNKYYSLYEAGSRPEHRCRLHRGSGKNALVPNAHDFAPVLFCPVYNFFFNTSFVDKNDKNFCFQNRFHN